MLPAPSTLSLQYRVHGSFYRGQKIRFFMFSVCLELWELPQLMPPPPLHYVLVWFLYGSSSEQSSFFLFGKYSRGILFYRVGKVGFL